MYFHFYSIFAISITVYYQSGESPMEIARAAIFMILTALFVRADSVKPQLAEANEKIVVVTPFKFNVPKGWGVIKIAKHFNVTPENILQTNPQIAKRKKLFLYLNEPIVIPSVVQTRISVALDSFAASATTKILITKQEIDAIKAENNELKTKLSRIQGDSETLRSLMFLGMLLVLSASAIGIGAILFLTVSSTKKPLKQNTKIPLEKLIEIMKEISKIPSVMSPEECRAQAISFAFGILAIDNPSITRKMVEEAYDQLLREGRISP